MSYIISFLPLYVLGNFHCIGMCGPLVMFLGQHPNRYAYFLGRIVAFTLVGMMSGEIGSLFQVAFSRFHIPVAMSFICGIFLLAIGGMYFFEVRFSGKGKIFQKLEQLSQKAAVLMLKERFSAIFLFGLCTILLPCGQSLMVFSASALSGNAGLGALNSFIFAILTTPSLWLAMKAQKLLKLCKQYYHKMMGICCLFVASIAICRGLAEIEIIPHLVFSPFHIVIF